MNTCPSPHVKRRRSGGATLPTNDMKSPTPRKRTTVKQPTIDEAIAGMRQSLMIGNQFWKARSSHGRNPIFSNPEALWDACLQYFDWVAEHPLLEAQAFAYQGEITENTLPKMRAMTIGGLCIFLDIAHVTWIDYRTNKGGGFSKVCGQAEQVIREQKFTGAAAGLLNHAIIARDLGLVDKKDVTSNGESIAPRVQEGMDPKQAAEAFAQLMREIKLK